MDVLLRFGDIAPVSSGLYTYISGIDEAVQRVRIAALTAKGSFIYDRELGTDYGALSSDDEMLLEKLDMLIREACCDIAETEVRAVSCDSETGTLGISVTYRGNTTSTEVDISGFLR